MSTNRPDQVASMVAATLRRNALRGKGARSSDEDVAAFAASVGRFTTPRGDKYRGETLRLFRIVSLRDVLLAEAEWLRVFLAGTPEEALAAQEIVNAMPETASPIMPAMVAIQRRSWRREAIEAWIADRERRASHYNEEYRTAIRR